MQSVPITTNVVSSNLLRRGSHYVIKFVSNLRQISGFLWVSSTNKTDRHDINEIWLKVVLNIITLTLLNIHLT
jgi:hypothetical protein